MARSYRKPWAVDGYGTKRKQTEKRWANKAVRRATDVPNGKGYRKFYPQWDICDYRWLILEPVSSTCQFGFYRSLEKQWDAYRRLTRK